MQETSFSRNRGIVAGLLAAGSGLAAGELVAGLFRDAVSPVVPPGQIVIDHVPPSVKEWAIRTFGTADKAVLVGGALVVLLGLGILVGVLVAKGQWRAALGVQAATAMVGVAAVLDRPDPSFVKVLPAIVASSSAAAVLWWLVRRRAAVDAVDAADSVDATEAEAPAVPTPVMALGRRRVLTTGLVVAGGAAATGGLGRWLARRHQVDVERQEVVLAGPAEPAATLPADAEFGVPGLSPFLTPTADFYRIDTALVVPQISRAGWKLKIHGMVDRELTLTYDELVSRPLIERYMTLSCVSNEVGGDLIGNARWLGVRLADVLDEAGIDPKATQLASRSADGWTCGTPVSVVMDGRDALLAVAMNGEPLPAKHGYPVRMVVPGLYGYVSATKWVTEIELTTWDAFEGYWVPRGWSREAPIKVESRIDTPRDRREVAAGSVPVAGVAWAVHRGIAQVEVRIDEGSWETAELAGVPSDDTWRQWRYLWDATSGEHTIEVRATTGDGEVQTEDRARPAPDGATGYHRIRVTVT